ncbi:pilin [Pelagibaculum spongiae]|uniref:Prepilin-type cleavage/methylation domain-containing protein n=1 Tax=Pelagibaculum spongiae TaxID=2080658 RepID=A0A2V1GWB7_9GAMM|nr:pilin [Pelagibaculum spongiae]PVZ63409.1 hypothetical protein DC094_21100 [Pelagibaculum spongiae]
MNKYSGLTLIELMLVLLVVGFVSIYSFLAYEKNLNRARFSEVLSEISSIKIDVNEFAAMHLRFPSMVERFYGKDYKFYQRDIFMSTWSSDDLYVIQIKILDNGFVEHIQFYGKLSPLHPGTISWNCLVESQTLGGPGSARFAPNSCVHQNVFVYENKP